MAKRALGLVVGFVALWSASFFVAAQEKSVNPDINKPFANPDLKKYLETFEGESREIFVKRQEIVRACKLKPGLVVADIGAGSGWFTVRAARRVGAKGKVYAVDINPDYLRHIEERALTEKLPNIHTVLGKEDDPLLPPEIDAALILKTYHEIAQPILLLAHLRQSMRAEGLLGIIDRNGNGKDHGIGRLTVISEAKDAGFSLFDEYDFVKPDGMDYFLVFGVE